MNVQASIGYMASMMNVSLYMISLFCLVLQLRKHILSVIKPTDPITDCTLRRLT